MLSASDCQWQMWGNSSNVFLSKEEKKRRNIRGQLRKRNTCSWDGSVPLINGLGVIKAQMLKARDYQQLGSKSVAQTIIFKNLFIFTAYYSSFYSKTSEKKIVTITEINNLMLFPQTI